MECEVDVEGVRLEHVSEFKYLGSVLNKAGTYVQKKKEGGKLEEDGRSLVNAMDLQIECTRALHETVLVPVLT